VTAEGEAMKGCTTMTNEPEITDHAILKIIEDAIWEGAREWDAYAIPASKEPAEKALQKIKELLSV
jgi:hypothetical protein